MRIKTIPNIIGSTNKVMRIPVPFNLIVDDSLTGPAADGFTTIRIPKRIRQDAPIRHKTIPILLLLSVAGVCACFA